MWEQVYDFSQGGYFLICFFILSFFFNFIYLIYVILWPLVSPEYTNFSDSNCCWYYRFYFVSGVVALQGVREFLEILIPTPNLSQNQSLLSYPILPLQAMFPGTWAWKFPQGGSNVCLHLTPQLFYFFIFDLSGFLLISWHLKYAFKIMFVIFYPEFSKVLSRKFSISHF